MKPALRALTAASLPVFAAAFAPQAMAVTWHDVTMASPITGSGLVSVTYDPSPAVKIWYTSDNVTPQSDAHIKSVVQSVFGVTGLTSVSQCDKPTSDCTNATGGTTTGTYSNTFHSNSKFDYLAVHFGSNELLFHWSAGITDFKIGNLPNGLSNYRAYATPVPEPETYAMFLAGLGLLGAVARRRTVRT